MQPDAWDPARYEQFSAERLAPGLDLLALITPAPGMRICFESLCDIQHTLPFEDAAEIRQEADLLLEHWATPQGGFILSDYGDGNAIGVPLDKKQIMLDAFLQADPWRNQSVSVPSLR